MANTFRALPPSVLADLLQLPGRERFCLATLSWLLETEAEHGLGDAMLQRFGDFLEHQELGELGAALQILPVTTEVVERGETVDLIVKFAESPRMALLIANRLLVNSPILHEYRDLEMTPIGLRLPGDPPSKQLGSFPVWDWLRPVPALSEQAPPGPYGDFLRQFGQRLGGVDAGPLGPAAWSPAAPPAATTPPPPAPAPSGYGGGWGDDTGGSLADSWSGGDGGGGLADAWMDDLES